MTIVCGTDFSERARQAARAAAAIAARFGERLVLVHVADESGAELSDGTPEQPLCGPLRQEATELRAIAPQVEEVLASGAVDVALAEAARRYEARMLVVSSLGRRAPARWLIGSVAEQAAQAAPVPVLVARGGGAFEAWARGERRLRVLVGVDGSPAARAALDWIGELRRVGACDVTAAYVASPPEEHARLGV
ncbi:MAG TPA: universal stress protein, partial [Polyangiaceae bacterium]|nr:universal stress protein [Polyangiaceae bacterium]